jgi:hypothetical protein
MPKTSLHTSLINWYARQGDEIEARVDGYFIDVLRGNELVEIQTRSFNKIKPKLERLLENHKVRLVHPIAAEKWIIREDKNDPTRLVKRKSPKHGRIEDIFHELVFIPDLIQKPNFTIEILIIKEQQSWLQDGSGSWRRRGWSIVDRALVEIQNQYIFQKQQDFINLLPSSLPESFTTRQVSELSKIPRRTAQKMIYCLHKMGGLSLKAMVGKEKWYSIDDTHSDEERRIGLSGKQ